LAPKPGLFLVCNASAMALFARKQQELDDAFHVSWQCLWLHRDTHHCHLGKAPEWQAGNAAYERSDRCPGVQIAAILFFISNKLTVHV